MTALSHIRFWLTRMNSENRNKHTFKKDENEENNFSDNSWNFDY